MKNLEAQSVEELTTLLATFGDDAMFRGQVTNYGTEQAPRLNTSFNRNGCIPPLMLRWSHYSRFLLAALFDIPEREVSNEWSQAVLQHYGWRSFYLDVSLDNAVAAWFAAHAFSSKSTFELCEDCFEEPVFLAKRAAQYTFAEGEGYLYVLSKEAVAKDGLTVFDLSSISADDCRPRFIAQKAALIGVLQGDLPVGCLSAMIKAPRAVLRDYAAKSGLSATSDLFPHAKEDPLLFTLLNLPWLQVPHPDNRIGIDFFRQPIELPEYEESFTKINPSHVAMYRHDSAADTSAAPDVTFYDAPEDIIFGTADPIADRFPRLAQLVRKHGGHVVFEIDNLVRRPGVAKSDYVKGIAVQLRDDGKFAVADFAVDYRGQKMGGCGINKGWSYAEDADGRWRRVVHEDDCPCGNQSVHTHHLSGLTILEQMLGEQPPTVVRHQRKTT